MDFSLSKQQNLFLQMIREFAEKEVKPLAAEVDESERFPIETVEKMAKLGIMGIPFPTEYGGAGGDNQLYTMAVEELSRVCATTGVIVSGVENDNVAFGNSVLTIPARKAPPAAFHEAYDIVLVEVIRERLLDAFKAICLYMQLTVVNHGLNFSVHS